MDHTDRGRPGGGASGRLAVRLTADYSPRVNFAMQQSHTPLVESVGVHNTGPDPLIGLTVEVALRGGACEPWIGRVDRIEPGETFRLSPTSMALSVSAMAELTEAERTHLVLRARGSADALAEEALPIDLLPFDHWPGAQVYPELLGAFVTPNHPAIADLLQAARSALKRMSGRDALDGYQSGTRIRAAQIAEACVAALAASNIGYINPPASFDQEGQRVRLADRVLREKLGSCLDLSLLLAGMWEQAGLHPLVLLLDGHAMPAVWTHGACLPETVIDEAARVRNLIELGEIVAVESTLLTQGPDSPFAAAVTSARQRLASPGAGFCAVDIAACRKRSVRPLPLRVEATATRIDLESIVPADAAQPTETVLPRVALADRVAAGDGAVGVRVSESGEERIRRWQTRLLDLTLRNRLISFRPTGKTLHLRTPDLALLKDVLAEQRIGILSKSEEGEEFLRQELKSGRVYAAEAPAELQKRLLQIWRTAKSSIEETGANLLYLSIGMLKWYETDEAETPRLAPLLLLPVALTRNASGGGYRYDLSLTDEPVRPNITLLEKLRADFGISAPELAELPEDEKGIDVEQVLHRFRAVIRDSKRWEVEEVAHLGLFSFNKFLMWRDLQENGERLRQNRLVRHLIDRTADEFGGSEPFPQPERLDDEIKAGELLCTRDADSTQLAAIAAAARGRTFVLEGPPGTGKSQTIANIVADSIGRGKRVLFVAEKMAALGVVKDRLDKDGLGPFCLELHSAKATKAEVIKQLESALHASREAGAGTAAVWSEACANLQSAGNTLNSYVRELHALRSSGESLFQVLSRLARLGDGPRCALPGVDWPALDKQQLAKWRTCIGTLVDRAEHVDPAGRHPLAGVGVSAFRFGLDAEARGQIDSAAQALLALEACIQDFLSSLSLDSRTEPLDGATVRGLGQIGALLAEPKTPHERMVVDANAPALVEDVTQLSALGRRRDDVRADLLRRWRPEFLKADASSIAAAVNRAMQSPRLLRPLSQFLVRRRFRKLCHAQVPSVAALREDVSRLEEVQRASAVLAGAKHAEELFGNSWKCGETDWSMVDAAVAWSRRFHQCAGDINPRAKAALARAYPQDAARLALAATGDRLGECWKAWTNAREALVNHLAAPTIGAAEDPQPAWIARTRARLDRLRTGLGELSSWCAWMLARGQAVDAGLGDVVGLYEGGSLTRAQLAQAFERSYGEAWFNGVANTVAPIREFNAAVHARTIEKFGAADHAMIGATAAVVAARVAERAPASGAPVSGQSEIGILRREIQKKTRRLPTRRLIEAIPNLLPRLKPCFLMSPLSVAQYLDARLPPFDLVVFDEASQIPVWDAIGAIARGTEVIVVGDSKQLPPTSFFETLDSESDEEVSETRIEDMQSILQECSASGVASLMLRWHYRSRHESLIAFSNHHYYKNGLHTFPSPETRSASLGVSLRYLPDGVYDRGGSRTNRIEAQRVVDEVVRLLRENPNPDSIGVVTFSLAQQTLIEDLLDIQRREHPELERFFGADCPEPVFIKNLENVQGDERDTIVFSVGYGPDQHGRPSMNFGPLNQEGGERRLNVAVTRARRRLIVFSSLRADQIDLKRTRALGVRHFKTFLDYADRGPRAIAEATDRGASGEVESGFEQSVLDALVARGWQVDTQVGCAGYRVDLALRDPERPGRYLLGIECDGASYHSAKTARDRDRLRQAVLEGLGWKIARIWSTEWRINSARCLAAVEQAAQHARSGQWPAPVLTPEPAQPPSAPAPVGSIVSPPVTQPPRPLALPEYRAATPPTHLADIDLFAVQSLPRATEAFVSLVAQESPLVEELALRRLAQWFGIQRVTDRYRQRFAQIREVAAADGTIFLDQGCLWPAGARPAEFTLARTPGPDEADWRDLEDIPLVERVNGVTHVLRRQFGLPREDLERELAKLFGTARLTPRAREAAGEAVDAALSAGRATAAEDRVNLPANSAVARD